MTGLGSTTGFLRNGVSFPTSGWEIGVAVVQELRQIPAIQAFLERYPGHTISPVEWHGFPLWMRCMHFFNLFLMFLIIRAGIQILADHPRLYWNVDCTPGT